jgi:phosphate transport system permease protein
MISARTADRIAIGTLWMVAVVAVLLLVLIIFHLIEVALPDMNLSFVLGDPSSTEVGGIFPVIWNSIYMLVLTMLITAPFAVLAGIYMSEYATPNAVTDGIRFAQEAMSSVPSIVIGLVGLIVFVGMFRLGFSALAGALALVVFNLPLMARLTEQAIAAVPQDERMASMGLGATKWQTIVKVVLPIAIPGIVTSFVLTAGRIFGEAAALIFTAGLATPPAYDFTNFDLLSPASPWSPLHPATTLSVYIWKLNSEGIGEFSDRIADGAAAVLIIVVLLFNVSSRLLGRALSRRLTAR